uniref:Fe2OG dioxygenase domain-containing protein n=1 Tax=Phaseolus vulgaris TaxID=3885 RepID=V7CJT3_PHAVU|nr:hypothetical protein PHAVU_002G149600g [Phaseolus vulgaris]ESW30389.1 hypothetical protein PHAVU_002G149600g [Phaseolus vulgaris]
MGFLNRFATKWFQQLLTFLICLQRKENSSTQQIIPRPQNFTIITSKVEGGEKVKMWSECFSHSWYPIEDLTHLLPQEIGIQYGEAFSEYAREIGSLVRRVLGLISTGLGIEEDCLVKILGDEPRLRAQANFYPPCPDPELTLGLPVHTDVNVLTVILQSQVSGLQVIKDGKWIAVPAIPNAFVINLGDQIQKVQTN